MGTNLSKSEAIRTIREIDDPVITPLLAAQAIGTNPHLIRIQARTAPESLGFRTICIGSRVKIPRIPFLEYLGIDEAG